MAVTALDTHEVVKELIAAGFTDVQAEAVTRQLRLAQNVDVSNLMTKSDGTAIETRVTSLETSVRSLETRLRAEIAQIKSDVEKNLAETKAELLKWMVGTIGVQTVIILGTVITLIRIMSNYAANPK